MSESSHLLTRSPRRWIAGATLMALVAAAPMSHAQQAASSSPPPAAADANADEARHQFEIGVEALRDERYPDALTAFQASYRARRAASVALNLGVTLRALGRLVEARDYFQEFLRDASATQHAEHDPLVQNYLVDLNRRIGELTVQGELPDDAVISLDNHRAALSATSTLAVDPGDHTLVVRARGFRPSRNEVHVAAGGRASVTVTLEPSGPSETTTRVLGSSAPPQQGTPHRDVAAPPAYRNPWLWVGVGAIVAAVIIVPIAIAASSGPHDPAGTSTGRVIQGLSR